MIGYGTRKIILKFSPFWISNKELQEREIQNILPLEKKIMKENDENRIQPLLCVSLFVFLFSFDFEISKSKSISDTTKCNITLNFPALDFPRSIGRKGAGISK